MTPTEHEHGKAYGREDRLHDRLRERLYACMVYKCEGRRLKGVEKAAFHLHCSPRQLQRILNDLVRDGVARKTGKGAYELCPGTTQMRRSGQEMP